MATATAHASGSLGTAVPVRAYLELDNATIVDPEATIDLGVLPGTRGGRPHPEEVSWTVRVVDDSQPVRIDIVVSSEKAGVARSAVWLAQDQRAANRGRVPSRVDFTAPGR